MVTPDSINKEAPLPDESTSKIQLSIAKELEKSGFYSDAADRYERARTLDPKLTNLSGRLALLYDRAGNERKAMEEYEAAILQNPKDADLLNNLGFCHYNRGRWTDAETCFRHALAVNPNHKRANINLGLALAQQGKIEEAMESFLRVTRAAEAKANIAFVLAAQGKKAEAKTHYQQALKLEPGLTVAQSGLAALDAPKKSENLDPNVRTVGAEFNCLDGRCVTGALASPMPDMSPITVDPRAAKNVRTESAEAGGTE